MKPLSEEVKSEIRRLAGEMIAITSRACDECGITSEAEADLMASMIAVELQTELARHINSGETWTSKVDVQSSQKKPVFIEDALMLSLSKYFSPDDPLDKHVRAYAKDGAAFITERVQKLASYWDKGAAYEPFPDGYRKALKDCAKELREAFEK